MRAGDVVVCNIYILTRDPHEDDYRVDGNHCSHRGGTGLTAGALLECHSVTPRVRHHYYGTPGGSTFYVLNTDGTRSEKQVVFTIHGSLKLHDRSNMNSDRMRKAATLKRENTQNETKLKTLETEVYNLKKSIAANADRIQKLEMFKDDNEELAHTLAEIMKTGGDTDKIQEILKNRVTTDRL